MSTTPKVCIEFSNMFLQFWNSCKLTVISETAVVAVYIKTAVQINSVQSANWSRMWLPTDVSLSTYIYRECDHYTLLWDKTTEYIQHSSHT